MEANKRILTDFINNNESYEIPFFQRSYVWGVDQWQRLIDDIVFASSSKKPMFLGAIIFKKKLDENGMADGYTVIDGQQRLTTLFIFFKVLCLVTNQGMWFQSTFLTSRENEPVLTQSHSNKDDFNRIMTLRMTEEIPTSENESQIIKAYRFFLDQLSEIFFQKRNKNSDGSSILDYERLYRYMNFVVITLDRNEDEQQIFDTINSLGVKLTTGELLKNYLFTGSQIDDYNVIWKPVFEDSEETIKFWNLQLTTGRLNKKTIDVFLYYFLQIRTQDKDIKGDKKLFRRWENLFSSYKTLVDLNRIDKEILAHNITEYANLFMECFRSDEDGGDIPSSFGIERLSFIINNLDTTTIIPYMLYILHEVSDQVERNKIFGYLEKYIVRRVIVEANNNNYSDFFTENLIGQRIKSYEALVGYIESKDPSVSLAMPSDEAVVKGFKETRFRNNKKALAVLFLLESKLHTASHSSALRTFDAYTLEHLMPKKWKKYWDTPTTGTDADRDTTILTLGNLALISKGLNNAIRNYDWNTKKTGKNNKPGLKEFAAGIITLSNDLELTNWDESTIEARAQRLANLAIEEWKINAQND